MSADEDRYLIPAEYVEAIEQYAKEHPPRTTSIDETSFLPHKPECPACHCGRHCRCFDSAS